MQKHPTCYVIAGPNGAGKTTFAMKYLPEIADCRIFINADEIAKGLSPLDVEAAQLQASKIFLSSIDEHIRRRENFAFETTLSGKTYQKKIREWREAGWQVKLFYLWLPNAESSARRVEFRVKQGGHNIPLEAIERRYPRSIENLFEYAEICDSVTCYDNSESIVELIFSQNDGILVVENEEKFNLLREFIRK